MKKFLAMLLACASVCAFAACGGTGSSTGESTGGAENSSDNGGSMLDTQVTADEFAAAFNLGDNYSCTATITYEGQGIECWGWYRAGNLLRSTVETRNLDGTAIEGEHVTENFVEKDGDTVYYYTPSYGIDGTLECFNKYESEESFETLEYAELGMLLAVGAQDFASFTFNAVTQAYEASEIVMSESQSAKNISFKFVDNKLVSGSYDMAMTYDGETMIMPVSLEITYGGVTITLPTNLGEPSIGK